MVRACFIGDEATAAGYRLAGVATRVPSAGETSEVLRRVRADGTELVLLAAGSAREIDPAELEDVIVADRPLVAIVPDVYSRHAPPDVAHDTRFALGIES